MAWAEVEGTPKWEVEKCNTYYLYKLNEIKCECNSVNPNSYYTIVQDNQRIEVDPVDWGDHNPVFYYKFDDKIFVIIAFILFLTLPMACCCTFRDSLSYAIVSDRLDTKVNHLIEEVARKKK